MLKIGEFSKLSRVSVRMLRHYDDIGLLHPAYIDRFTDYRYYSEAQLPTVCRITALKDMGFRLADICRMLDFYDDRQRLDECLAAHPGGSLLCSECQRRPCVREERAVCCQWQMKHGERVAAVKISAALMPLRNFGHRNRSCQLRRHSRRDRD